MSNFFQNMFPSRGRSQQQAARPPHSMFDEFLNGMAQAAGLGMHAQGGGPNVQRDPEEGPPPTARRILLSLKEECLELVDIENGNDTCSVCFEEQHVGDLAIRLGCGHAFHKTCVYPWLEKHCTCPVCRYELESVAGYSENTMTGAEKMQRERLKRQKERDRRAREQELIRKRNRMSQMDEDDRKVSAKNHENVGPSQGSRVGPSGEQQNQPSRNPFDLYSPSPPRNTAGKQPAESSYNPFDEFEEEGTDKSGVAVEKPEASYSNNHYAGRSDDDIFAVSQALSIGQLKKVLVHLGLAETVTRAVDKRDLLEALANAGHVPSLIKLPVKELKRRLARLEKDLTGMYDKQEIAKALRTAVIEYVYTSCF